MIGAGVGALGFVWPGIIGGGDPITAGVLAGGQPVTLVAVMFVVRFGLGAISYAAATPGGLFAPLLTLGAQLGFLFGAACHWAFPGLDVPGTSFALVGMAAFFTGVVRSPLTGMVLVSEMTGNVTLLLPTLGACAFAMLVAGAAAQCADLRHACARPCCGGPAARRARARRFLRDSCGAPHSTRPPRIHFNVSGEVNSGGALQPGSVGLVAAVFGRLIFPDPHLKASCSFPVLGA